jgi:prophage antirepressor-like protein
LYILAHNCLWFGPLRNFPDAVKINKKEEQTMAQNKIVVFESKKIRRIWHNEEWYFSVVDVCGALTDRPDAGAYWRKLKQRLNEEGSEVVTFCHGLKLEAPDGKMRETDCANTKGMFRIIQSIPSPKAEPFNYGWTRWIRNKSRKLKYDRHPPTGA